MKKEPPRYCLSSITDFFCPMWSFSHSYPKPSMLYFPLNSWASYNSWFTFLSISFFLFRSYLSCFLSWCVEWFFLSLLPFRGIKSSMYELHRELAINSVSQSGNSFWTKSSISKPFINKWNFFFCDSLE